jgi:hypothetical protein
MRSLRDSIRYALLALVASAAIAPALAHADAAVGLVGTFSDTQSGATGYAAGVLAISSFSAEGGGLIGTGSDAFGFCIPDVDPKNCQASFGGPVTVSVTSVAGDCDAILVEVEPIRETVSDGRFVVDLETFGPLVLDGGPRGLRCAVARRTSSDAAPQSLAGALTRLAQATTSG